MPAPWQASKEVRVMYHRTGALTVVDEIPRVAPPIYTAQWATAWAAMRREKKARKHFRRMQFPPFDDEEPVADWREASASELPEPVQIDTELEWLYDDHPLEEEFGEGYHRWHLLGDQQAELARLAAPLTQHNRSPFLLDLPAMTTAKALNVAIPGGPKFEPLDRKDPMDEDLLDFNALDRVVYRGGIRSEYRVVYPWAYGASVEAVEAVDIGFKVPCGGPHEAYTFGDYHEMKQGKSQPVVLPDQPVVVTPPLAQSPITSAKLTPAIALLSSTSPFGSCTGQTRRAQDVLLVGAWAGAHLRNQPTKTRVSQQRLLKKRVKALLRGKHTPRGSSPLGLLRQLGQTRFFHHTHIDWCEAGLQLCRQGHHMLTLMIHKRGLTYLHLDYNFNLKPTRTLTTKERKRLRFGNAFHLVRELLRATKMVVDAHVQFRQGTVDAFQLADGLLYALNHLGQLTGIYRYKYKVMRQVRACKDLKHLVYSRFNAGIGKGPGCGFWQPAWREWVFFMRGLTPLLERWLGNLLTRQFEGRHVNEAAKSVTKQRVDAYYDLELRAQVMHDILDMVPEGMRALRAKPVLQHLSEAWRCWKANVPWRAPGLPLPVQALVERYIQAKADRWSHTTKQTRERIMGGMVVEKTVAKKNLGRMVRMWLKAEQERQLRYLRQGPSVSSDEAVAMLRTTAGWLEETQFQPIPFPPQLYKHDTKLLVLALEQLKEGFSPEMRLTGSQREELELIQEGFDSPHETLAKVKKALISQRVFKETQFEMVDHYTHLEPVNKVDPAEKIVDSYLDQYLWFEADRRGLFPSWVKPGDGEVPPLLVYKWCQGINAIPDVWDTSQGQRVAVLETTLANMTENIDLTLLKRLLGLVVDPVIADYIVAKFNVGIAFKDMAHTNHVGVLRGVAFSLFVIQLYGLALDLLVLGDRAALLAAGTPSSHPIQMYTRYVDRVHLAVRMDAPTAQELVDAHQVDASQAYPNKRCWPRESRMRMMRHDVAFGRALFAEIASRLPPLVTTLPWASLFVGVYSRDNPNLLFGMCGFEVRMHPRTSPLVSESVWPLVDAATRATTAYAHLQVSPTLVSSFEARIRQILQLLGTSTFTKIGGKWNTALVALCAYFREAVVGTPGLLDVLVRCETRIQNRVKLGLNLKMPLRFPPCVFYTPKELGGLGMLLALHVLIPALDLHGPTTHFRQGMSHDDDRLIPTLFRYLTPWETEFGDSARVWADYALKRQEAVAQNRRLTYEDVAELWDRGLPRIATLFQKDRHTLAYDKGHRLRRDFRRYSHPRFSPFWWTLSHHDGRLWLLEAYRQDVVQALGGVETILSHTMYAATGFSLWEGLFWEKQAGFEDTLKYKRLTNAQRLGLLQIPNRRFTLWWLPTINRANVYVGFLVQLDLTGVFLHGKIPTLKIALVQMFRAHLWQKIHESVVVDLCQVLDREADVLRIGGVSKQAVHPRKLYKMNSGGADIVATAAHSWPVSTPLSLHDQHDQDLGTPVTSFWIDVQLRYGDYDLHDVARYARAKFLDYTLDAALAYPLPAGLVVAIDLAYNSADVYGTWIPGMKPLMQAALGAVMKLNPALHVLRERVRKGLQLHQLTPQDQLLLTSNYAELFGGRRVWLVDDLNVYRVVIHRTVEGNAATKPVNGALAVVAPGTGQLYLKVIHTSVWAGQKRLGQLAKWKAAEEVAALVRLMGGDEQPETVVACRKNMGDPLEVHMLDFPRVTVQHTELKLPLAALMKVERIAQVVQNATEPQMALFNLYDDWLRLVSAYTAFQRVSLVLRALEVLSERVAAALHAPGAPTAEHHLWPLLLDEQWVGVEAQLRDMIVEEFCEREGVASASLTQTEVRDLILGGVVKPRAVEETAAPTAIKATTVNAHGEQITTVTTTLYEQQHFASQTDWRVRAVAAAQLPLRCKHVYVSDGTGDITYVFPRDLLLLFVSCADSRSVVGGYLYGSLPKGHPEVVEVGCLAMPPQVGSPAGVEMARPGASPKGMIPVGWVCTSPGDTPVSPRDVAMAARLSETWGSACVTFVAGFTPGSITVSAYSLTNEGREWGLASPDGLADNPDGFSADYAVLAPVMVSDRIHGFAQVPAGGTWNYAFRGVEWNQERAWDACVGIPPRYHAQHAATGFSTLQQSDFGR